MVPTVTSILYGKKTKLKKSCQVYTHSYSNQVFRSIIFVCTVAPQSFFLALLFVVKRNSEFIIVPLHVQVYYIIEKLL